MSVSETFKTAWADVVAAGLPEHVQAAAFVEAVRIHSGSPGALEPTTKERQSGGGRGHESKSAENGKASAALDSGDFFKAIERETGVSVDDLERVIFLNDGVPQVNAARRKLGSSLKQQQVTATTLITVSRHFGLNESDVGDKHVRDECKRLSVFDRNFATNVKNIPGVLQTGDRAKVFKVRTAAIETFTDAVALVLGTTAEAES